jgi:coenzyme Q-binding protein COQ10
MTIIKKSIFINAPLEKVHSLASNPNNYALYMDCLSEPQNIKGNGGVGTVGEFKYELMGMHYSINFNITEDAIMPDGCITKGEISGGVSGKLAAAGVPKDSGTEVTYEFEYTVPGSIFGKIADKLIVEKKEEASLEKTLQNLKALCEAE